MYQNVKSKVKYDKSISSSFENSLGVRQGECLSSFLFAMYLNDSEKEFYLKGSDGIDIGMLKIFLLLYANDIIIFAQSAEELQNNLCFSYIRSKCPYREYVLTVCTTLAVPETAPIKCKTLKIRYFF